MGWALITGASAGIGLAFAQEFAARGMNLVLTARRMERLLQLAETLKAAHRIQVECISADLENPPAPNAIFDFTEARGIAVDTLVNNAGFGSCGPFAQLDGAREAAMIQVNCAAVVQLTNLYLPPMIQRGRGDIVILSSTAAFQGVPYMAVYAASKAFDLLFAEALAQEVKQFGIRVCAVCPGSTESEFDGLAGIPTERTLQIESAAQVVRTTLCALEAGKHSVVSGFRNLAAVQLQRLAPRRVATAIAGQMFRPRGENA